MHVYDTFIANDDMNIIVKYDTVASSSAVTKCCIGLSLLYIYIFSDYLIVAIRNCEQKFEI